MLSVMATTLSQPLHLSSSRTEAGCRCRPSQMASQYTSLSSTAPMMAGSCWWNSRMALKVWVAAAAPACTACMAVA